MASIPKSGEMKKIKNIQILLLSLPFLLILMLGKGDKGCKGVYQMRKGCNAYQ